MSSVRPDTLSVRTADNVALGYRTAGVGSRVAAQLVDGMLVAALLLLATLILTSATGSLDGRNGALIAAGLFVGSLFFIVFGYFFVIELVTGGRTPGKNALGLRVMMLDGRAPDAIALLIRNVVRIIDMLGGVGLLVMFFHPLSRRLGDLAAGTVVVRDKRRLTLAAAASPPPLILRTPDEGPAIDGIERLGRFEHNALRTFLGRPGLTPELRGRLAGELATRLYARLGLAVTAPERMWPPELFLERLYLQLDRRLP
jgi:uncharacterized RDD family membrane protein YckC